LPKEIRSRTMIYLRAFSTNWFKNQLCLSQCCGSGMLCSHKFHKIPNYFSFEVVKKKIWANFQRIIELFTQKIVTKLSKIWIWDPGSGIRDPGSEIRDPGSGKNLFRIPDPGSGSATLVSPWLWNKGDLPISTDFSLTQYRF
jgi:hypothetical protein